ncbi:Helicase conserved C-terminal domain-containing protein [Streptacidiphilus jiangxiensis]|uniref:Helicase conserved C-terminal domain-containing protein n=1 Tax=Streptacidiphilus jiangxiensis TaxID=235985 RepID=A0A1H7TKH3_STRJI|nr:Helicase conserved C-terminal domain-containing protein [Streptacidiphilus jiangxiensis]
MGQGGERRVVFARGQRLLDAARQVLGEERGAVERVRGSAGRLREQQVAEALAAIPVGRLNEVTEGRLRVGMLEAAGFATVAAVHGAEDYDLLRVPGIGRATAAQAKAAAAALADAAREATAVRLDPDHRTGSATELVTGLYPFVDAGPVLPAACERAATLAAALEPLLDTAAPARSRTAWWFAGRQRRTAARDALTTLEATLADARDGGAEEALAQALTDLLRLPGSEEQAWWEFLSRPVEFYTVLGRLAETGPVDAASAEGHLPDELAEQVRAQPLDVSGLTVSLRGYQAFGARYALARRKVVLGDEMGLGKTIQAVAALAHLAAAGERHFLVVCPASVLVNWLREIEARSTLTAFRLHGPERELAQQTWQRRGGVAVTTFEGLRHLDTDPPDPTDLPDPAVPADVAGPAGPKDALPLPLPLPLPPLAMTVVDEAHYVKNPAARRARHVAALVDRSERALFLTGTVMENHVGEFRNLLAYLQPELAAHLRDTDQVAGAAAFRRAVAPAYLRRNQQDVLTELPEVVHTDEWAEFSAADAAAYRDAVLAGNFQAMRRAAYAAADRSAKLDRLDEIVREAWAAGEKVLIFSFYRDVLEAVESRVCARSATGPAPVPGPGLFGPLTGGTAAAARQETVDDFTAHAGPAVLLSQIQAGGVGLNLQAANVVVLCEPQLKPALEQQAVARAHRMGQTRRVRVHRLLTPDSVDQRMLTLLGRKERLFDAYARRSDAAEVSPEALDVADTGLARQIIAEEQERLAAPSVTP